MAVSLCGGNQVGAENDTLRSSDGNIQSPLKADPFVSLVWSFSGYLVLPTPYCHHFVVRSRHQLLPSATDWPLGLLLPCLVTQQNMSPLTRRNPVPAPMLVTAKFPLGCLSGSLVVFSAAQAHRELKSTSLFTCEPSCPLRDVARVAFLKKQSTF